VGPGALVPVVPLVLEKLDGTKTPPLVALVDSGADSSLFPVSIAGLLGVDLASCAEIDGMTAGGVSKRFAASVPVVGDCCGKTITLNAAFEPNLPIILLGREDFFTHFKVVFDQRSRRLTVHPY
jgi:hypothetical protein